MAALRVLAVEDEPLLLMNLEDMLAELGHLVVGTATSVREAMIQAESGSFDVALLDVQLGGERIDLVAEALTARNLPIVFTTGCSEGDLPPGHASTIRVMKPFTAKALQLALQAALERRASG